ncbi:MAG: HAMP domain-containing histidine kinase [Elusimicrobia bacterium]|nr:HAMP domain-containing histidine kinase [Elusimicrobiota bacterium]
MGLHLTRLYAAPAFRWAGTVALLAFVAFLDWATGVEIAFSLFYLAPVIFASWTGGRGEGFVCALAATLTWHLLDAVFPPQRYSHPLIPVWNAGIRGVYFLSAAFVTAKVKASLERERAASRLKSDMLAFASHELNNSITSLGMGVFLMNENLSDPAYLAGVLPALTRTVEQMKLATSNFLESARLESGRFQLDRRPCELRGLVAASLELMRPFADKKGVTLRSEFPAAIVPLNADPDALSVIMANLIGNAVKYTPSGGSAEVVLVPDSPGPDQITVRVRDTGIGMSAQEIVKVFSGFHRTEAGKRTAKGYGIGLSVVQRLLTEHGAELKADGIPGRGTTFSFILPRA